MNKSSLQRFFVWSIFASLLAKGYQAFKASPLSFTPNRYYARLNPGLSEMQPVIIFDRHYKKKFKIYQENQSVIVELRATRRLNFFRR